jgi:ABC-type amino acid transport substrate-binding protein
MSQRKQAWLAGPVRDRSRHVYAPYPQQDEPAAAPNLEAFPGAGRRGGLARAVVWVAAWASLVCPPVLFGQEKKPGEGSRIIVGTELDYPPYSFSEDGHPTGFNVELTQAIAKVMGLDVEIRMGPWAEIRQSLEDRKIQAICGMASSEERARRVVFSPPYTIVQHAIFARRDSPALSSVEELRGKELIVMRGDIMHDYALENNLSSRIVAADTQAAALRLLASGKHDYALVAKLPGLY